MQCFFCLVLHLLSIIFLGEIGCYYEDIAVLILSLEVSSSGELPGISLDLVKEGEGIFFLINGCNFKIAMRPICLYPDNLDE